MKKKLNYLCIYAKKRKRKKNDEKWPGVAPGGGLQPRAVYNRHHCIQHLHNTHNTRISRKKKRRRKTKKVKGKKKKSIIKRIKNN